MTGTFSGVGREHVACVQHQIPTWMHPEGDEEQQRPHKDELDDRRALLIPGRRAPAHP